MFTLLLWLKLCEVGSHLSMNLSGVVVIHLHLLVYLCVSFLCGHLSSQRAEMFRLDFLFIRLKSAFKPLISVFRNAKNV